MWNVLHTRSVLRYYLAVQVSLSSVLSLSLLWLVKQWPEECLAKRLINNLSWLVCWDSSLNCLSWNFRKHQQFYFVRHSIAKHIDQAWPRQSGDLGLVHHTCWHEMQRSVINDDTCTSCLYLYAHKHTHTLILLLYFFSGNGCMSVPFAALLYLPICAWSFKDHGNHP